MTDERTFNFPDKVYEDGKTYVKVGDDWISTDGLVTKEQLLKLTDIVDKILVVMLLHDVTGSNGFEFERNKLTDLICELKK